MLHHHVLDLPIHPHSKEQAKGCRANGRWGRDQQECERLRGYDRYREPRLQVLDLGFLD
jgi:hypothetical protein